MQNPSTETEPFWCLGLRFLTSAPLTEAETAAVQVRSRRLVLGMAATVIFVPTIFATATVVELKAPQIADSFAMVAAILLIFGAPAAALFFVRFWVGYRRIQRDLKEGSVFVFAGPVRPRTPNRIRDRFERKAIARLPDEGTLEVRALPHSRCWLRQVTPSAARFEFLLVHLQRAAPPPSYAWRVPVHHDLPVVPLPGMRLEQRPLTALELTEIAAYVTQLRKPDLQMIFRLAICGLFFWIGIRERASGGYGIMVAVAVVFLAVHARRYWRRFSLASRLRADLASGRALSAAITEVSDDDMRVVSAASETNGAAGLTPREFLPMSKVLWTEGGRPATWREAGRHLRAA